jgi:DNA-binding transcriptional regulator YiaG
MELRVNSPSADQLKAAREEANLTQAELATRLGVSTRSVQHWEAGKVPQPKHRRAIASFLDEVEAAAA